MQLRTPLLALLSLLAPARAKEPASRREPARGVTTTATGHLMPVPAHLQWSTGALRVDSAFTMAVVRQVDDRLPRAIARLRTRLEARVGAPLPHLIARDTTGATLHIDISAAGQHVQGPGEDERYSLTIDSVHADLRAATMVGALRGMETLVQLLDVRQGRLVLPAVTIDDAPRFAWRGLLLDVARHFVPVEGVKRTVDGMAAVKLNVLHWHLSDDQGFRVESKRYPKLTASGSDGEFYTQEQVREVVAYARDRGIRVVPEFDMPSHSTAVLVGYPQFASIPGKYEIVRTYGSGEASFDPGNEATYAFIERLVGEMTRLFPDEYWHVGGDEVEAKHWNRSARVRAFKRRRHLTSNQEVQAYFNTRLMSILTRHKRRMVGWDEVLHAKLPRGTVVQSWRGEKYLGQATSGGYQSLLSAPYYLDHIKTAEEHYMADPIPPWTDLTEAQQALVLGGEACMWSEHVNAETIDSRLWPRLGVIAERFWSPREVNNVADMYRRMNLLDQQMAEFGLGRHLHQEHMVRRMTADDSVREASLTLLEAIAPPTFGQRIRGQRTTQLTPLVHMIDAAVPDPVGRWESSRLVSQLLGDPAMAWGGSDSEPPGDARQRLVAMLARWRAAVPVVRAGATGAPFIGELVPAADALDRVSAIGLEALEYVGTGMRAPQGWADPLLLELNDLEQPQMLLRLAVVPAVRRLVNAAALNSH
ncbi:MAG: family 20 glycosylhydrolase [Gemmatimonadaceae bacterium]